MPSKQRRKTHNTRLSSFSEAPNGRRGTGLQRRSTSLVPESGRRSSFEEEGVLYTVQVAVRSCQVDAF